MSNFFYGIGQGIKGMFQNKMFSFAAIGTVTACLFIFGVFFSVILNFRAIVYKAESQVGITVFFEENLAQADIEHIGVLIKQMKGVDSVKYVSPEEAWENFKKDKFENDEDLIETFGDENPLKDSASYVVKISDMKQEPTISKDIEALEGVRKVNSIEAVAGSINNFNLLVAYVSITLIVLLILVSVFLISSTVAMGISVRKEEIAIMKLIGATDRFVRFPFIVEGVLIGIIGAAIPVGLLYIFYGSASDYIAKQFPSISKWFDMVDSVSVFSVVIPASALLGIGIGLLGSAHSVRRHLKV
jgi:cell division transport system permease protein